MAMRPRSSPSISSSPLFHSVIRTPPLDRSSLSAHSKIDGLSNGRSLSAQIVRSTSGSETHPNPPPPPPSDQAQTPSTPLPTESGSGGGDNSPGNGSNNNGSNGGGSGRGDNNNEPSPSPRSSSQPPLLRFSQDEVAVCLAGLTIYLGMKHFVLEFRYIPSSSMLPTLREGDRVVVDKIVYRFQRPPQVNDLVVFSAPVVDPEFQGKAFLKRVVAVEGDKVEMRGEEFEKVWINGRLLNDRSPLLPPPFPRLEIEDGAEFIASKATAEEKKKKAESAKHKKDETTVVVVPAGCVFVMGDNRAVSYDSRFWGCLSIDHVIGRATRLYWPPHRWHVPLVTETKASSV